MENFDKAVENLKEILGKPECPMCHNHQFQVVDGFFNPSIQNSLSEVRLGGPALPCVALVCSKCGFLTQHAVGILDRDALKSSPKEEK